MSIGAKTKEVSEISMSLAQRAGYVIKKTSSFFEDSPRKIIFYISLVLVIIYRLQNKFIPFDLYIILGVFFVIEIYLFFKKENFNKILPSNEERKINGNIKK